MDLATLYRRTVETWTARVDTITPDQWSRPTPCDEWDVRQLVNHVVGEDRWTVPLVRGGTIAEVGDSLDGDLLGDYPVQAADSAAHAAVDSVAEALPSGGKVHLSYGDEDMGEYIHQLAADHLVHAWDLAAATGGDTHLDRELVEEVASWYADREELYRSVGAVGPHPGPAEEPQAILLAGFGRRADWSAS